MIQSIPGPPKGTRERSPLDGKWRVGASLFFFLSSRCTLPFKRRKSIMLRTLDIFSMIVIVGQPCLAPRAWQPHYSARGATVAAVASVRLSSDLPRLRLPIASLIVAFQQGYLFGERPACPETDREGIEFLAGIRFVDGRRLNLVVRSIEAN